MDQLARLKASLKEDVMPYFTDEALQELLDTSSSFREAVYRGAIMKSEDTTLSISGLKTNDTSAYFLRIARLYRPSNTGIIGG